jgi:hypothetical protein
MGSVIVPAGAAVGCPAGVIGPSAMTATPPARQHTRRLPARNGPTTLGRSVGCLPLSRRVVVLYILRPLPATVELLVKDSERTANRGAYDASTHL